MNPKASESLSQLTARVLNQFSISAWIPAATLVAIALVLANVRATHGDLQAAFESIVHMELQGLVLLFLAVVLATSVAQAFEFEAIRLFEGYWGAGRVLRPIADFRCRSHLDKLERLRHRAKELEDAAFSDACQHMLERGVPSLTVDILRAERCGDKVEAATQEDREDAFALGWRSFAQLPHIRRLDELNARLEEFPLLDQRILPTRLGNTLRSFEDRVHDPSEGHLEGMVQRVFDELPESLREELDQYRSRLDLYCSMALILVLATGAAILMLWEFGWKPPLIAAGVFATLALLNYRAAVASARGYGSALKSMRNLSRNDDVSGEPTALRGALRVLRRAGSDFLH